MGQIGVDQLPEVVWSRIIQPYKLCAPDVLRTVRIVFSCQLLAQQAGNDSNNILFDLLTLRVFDHMLCDLARAHVARQNDHMSFD
jgi:hypothetical protein